MNDNTNQIKNSLEASQKVFAGLEEYRIIGSILVAAINQKPHRELHDIDLLVDERIYEQISQRFKKLGFKRVTKHAPGFEWDEFQKEDHLTFGVLLRGGFNNDYFEYKPNRYSILRIDNKYLAPTNYELFRTKIRGIPLRSVYEGIKISSLNTKRRTDKEVVMRKIGNSPPSGLSLDQAFHVQILGINIPYFYTFFSQVYNLIGGARLIFGKPYDPWK